MFGNKPPKAERYIPEDILRAARSAGLEDPLWYVGRRRATPEELAELAELPSLEEIIEDSYRVAGLEPPDRVPFPPRDDMNPSNPEQA
jgi:hypothetical protein